MKKVVLILFWLLTLPVFADANKAMEHYLNQNYEKAYQLFKTTAELGHGKSQFNLGVQYLRGQGVKPDPVVAYAYLSTALANGFRMANQARKSVAKRLNSEQLDQAEKLSQHFIEKFGPNGSASITTSFNHSREFNPAPIKTKDRPADYPASLLKNGIPGYAKFLFDIDKNGVPRDLVLLDSYPDHSFAESMREKLRDVRYQRVKVSGSLRGFVDAQVTGKFIPESLGDVYKESFNQEFSRVLKRAQSGDIFAQALYSQMLLTKQLRESGVAYLVGDLNQQSLPQPPKVQIPDDSYPVFSANKTLPETFFNFSYFVWLDQKGRVVRHQPYQVFNIPEPFTKRAIAEMGNWQLTAIDSEFEGEETGPYLASFYYNNEPRHSDQLNYLQRAGLTVQPVVYRPAETVPEYWRLEAAKGGHSESLFLLGANCNLKLLKIAADNGFQPAQTQYAKCQLRQPNLSKDSLQKVEYYLSQAVQAGDVIAKRELAGLWARYAENNQQLHKAMELANQVIDETDSPIAYEYLAAAHAKLGQFKEAVEYQEEALDEAKQQEFHIAPIKERLANYQSNQTAIW